MFLISLVLLLCVVIGKVLSSGESKGNPMAKRQETIAAYSPGRVPQDVATLRGVIDYVSWYDDKPSLLFSIPNLPNHQSPSLQLTELLGQEVRFSLSEERYCTSCGAKSDRGICPDCAGEPPYTDCVRSPAKYCNYRSCPFPDYKQRSCSHAHVVYFTATDRIKVGITRESRTRQRWLEQGASHGIPVARAPNRKAAGLIEKTLGEEWAQKQSGGWYEPLEDPRHKLVEATLSAGELIHEDLMHLYIWGDADVNKIEEDVVSLPEFSTPGLNNKLAAKLHSVTPGENREGRVVGVRGGILATDRFVINLSKHDGRVITFEIDDEFLDDADLRVLDSEDTDSGNDLSEIDNIHELPTRGELA